MFTYEIKCLVCGREKVATVSYIDALSEKEITSRKSIGVCKSCAPNFKKAQDEKRKIEIADGPFFIKVGE